jgi:hypothetical protein
MGEVRSTQEIIEVSAQADDAEVRSTQEVIEVSAQADDAEVRSTQEVIEVSAERDDNEVRASQIMMEVSVLYTDWSSEGVARNGRHENGAPENVTPAWGPQGAWDVENYGERHAKDIYDGSPLYHWTQAQLLALLLTENLTLSVVEIDDTDSPYTPAETNGTIHIVADTGSGDITINLPELANVDGSYKVKNVGSGTVTLDGNGAETIDGDATFDLIEDESVEVVATSTEWSIF